MKFGEVDLAWIAAERATRVGDGSGDPLILASAARAGTHAMLARSRYQDALELGLAAAGWLEDTVDDHDEVALSSSGMLYLRIAISAARRGDRDATRELLRRAKAAGNRLGYDANLWHTVGGRTRPDLSGRSGGCHSRSKATRGAGTAHTSAVVSRTDLVARMPRPYLPLIVLASARQPWSTHLDSSGTPGLTP